MPGLFTALAGELTDWFSYSDKIGPEQLAHKNHLKF